ncbi:KxYKxGKxW signal peptide domain-containing protein [Ligilactobacillus equi]|uniref:KxYKxGKxW signal peptide domain-containing protein n=1 Tax=Ligilactobacillus equi TaxID=137357 RepID=UPI002ED0A73F
MEYKKRYKMYKAGKTWVVAPLVFLGLATGAFIGGASISADEIATNSDSEVVTSSMEATSSQEHAQVVTTLTEESALEQVSESENISPSDSTKVETTNSSVSEDSEVSAANAENQVTTEEHGGTADKQAESSATQVVVAATTTNVPKAETKNFYNAPENYVEKHENGSWYLYDTKTNQKYTGFQKLKDERIVYYNNQGQMQYNQQEITNNCKRHITGLFVYFFIQTFVCVRTLPYQYSMAEVFQVLPLQGNL